MQLLMILLMVWLVGLAPAVASDGPTDPLVESSPGPVISAESEYATLDSLFELYQPYIANISAYKSIYFLVGADPAKSKFQISFKYRVFNHKGKLVRAYPWLEGTYFGFTQTSYWDLKSDSLPFEDTSYKPELFHLSRNLVSGIPWLQGLFVKSGLQHESNGQGGDMSRSTNNLSIQPIWVRYNPETRLGLAVLLKVWAYLENSESNRNLPAYRGYCQLGLKAGKADSVVVETTLAWATEGGSLSMDFTFPMDRYVGQNLQFYFHVQYVNALAESLLHYQERTEALRVGFTFVR
ncbi:MAG: phospholipase A [Proteobacteria bacterium]|nr:phospholipase A [Pseudomonadota bacterium]MBU1687070.1 phospholipase A [Pseudomonadota bacterium]